MGRYGKSKLAAVLYTIELARRLASSNVTVNTLHTGAVASSIGVHRETGKQGLLYKLGTLVFKTEEEEAETSVFLATSPEVKGVTGKFFVNKKEEALTGQADDKDLAKKWYEATEKVLNQFSFIEL